MSLDYPRAWELARAATPGDHHPKCSYIQSGGAVLCDLACPVLNDSPETGCPALHSVSGRIARQGGPYGFCTCQPDHTQGRNVIMTDRASIETAFRHRHPGTISLLGHFANDHLPEPLKTYSGECGHLAQIMVHELPDSAELTAGLRKLLEAKDCFVRAALDKQT